MLVGQRGVAERLRPAGHRGLPSSRPQTHPCAAHAAGSLKLRPHPRQTVVLLCPTCVRSNGFQDAYATPTAASSCAGITPSLGVATSCHISSPHVNRIPSESSAGKILEPSLMGDRKSVV